jgi:signal transduction histidine kinase/ActR/RegA family two-component response regulator
VGRPYEDRFPEPARSFIADQIRERAAGLEWNGEFQDYRKDGSRVWIDARVGPVRDADGRIVGILGVSHDISERKRAEEALREADRRKDEFLAVLAHELRNPLAPLRNGLEVMKLAASDAQAVSQTRAIMERQLGHMVRLIDDLLDVSRITRNKMELRRARVPLAEVVSSAVETARPAIEEAGHVLTVSLPTQRVHLDADLTRLAQVFGNLLSNSAKYTPRGGRIGLSAERKGQEVVVAVSDNGIGIPAESLHNIFAMFSQVDRSIERSTGGLGIGLALVKGLVEMHGGTVTAESPGPGQGSTFRVRLPVLDERAEPLPKSPADEGRRATGRRRRILVVDDNRDSAASMAMMLELTGNEVWTAQDGIEAVELAGTFRPQVILMDVGMPRLNGLEATRRIRQQTWGQATTIIALTGWGQAGDKARSREAGCDGHLVKPVHILDLEKLLAEIRASP